MSANVTLPGNTPGEDKAEQDALALVPQNLEEWSVGYYSWLRKVVNSLKS